MTDRDYRQTDMQKKRAAYKYKIVVAPLHGSAAFEQDSQARLRTNGRNACDRCTYNNANGSRFANLQLTAVDRKKKRIRHIIEFSRPFFLFSHTASREGYTERIEAHERSSI